MRLLSLVLAALLFPAVAIGQSIDIKGLQRADLEETIRIIRDFPERELTEDIVDSLVPRSLIDAFAPGSDQRKYYDEIRHYDMRDHFRCPILTVCDSFYLDLPDENAFFDFHFREMVSLRERLGQANGKSWSVVVNDLIDLGRLIETHDSIMLILRSVGISSIDEAIELTSELPELLARRYFSDPVKPISFALSHVADWQMEMGPLSFPSVHPALSEVMKFRTVTFQAENTGEVAVDEVEFIISSPVVFSTIEGGCSGDTIKICPRPVVDGKAEVTVTLYEPDTPLDVAETAWIDVDVILSAIVPEGQQAEVGDRWSLQVGWCEAHLDERLLPLAGRVQGSENVVDQLDFLRERISDLPGRQMFSGPTNLSLEQTTLTPSDRNGYRPLGEVSARLTTVVTGLGNDGYLQANQNGSGELSDVSRAINRMISESSCGDADGWAADLEILDTGLETLHARQEDYQRLAAQAASAEYFWRERVQYALARLPIQEQSTAEVETAKVFGASYIGSLINISVGFVSGGAAMEAFAFRANAIGALMGTIQVLEAGYDLVELFALEKEIHEASFWLEANAYFEGVSLRYQNTIDHLEDVRGRLTYSRSFACSCFIPEMP